jgi:hypothetical protein
MLQPLNHEFCENNVEMYHNFFQEKLAYFISRYFQCLRIPKTMLNDCITNTTLF